MAEWKYANGVASIEAFPDEPEMTLRDEFAIAALPDVIKAQAEFYETGGTQTMSLAKSAAEGAYNIADAMLAERERKL